MYQINISKIKGKMGEKNISITELSQQIGVSRNTLSSYFKNPAKMPYNIVSKMAQVVCDTQDEAVSIFFAQ